MDSLYESIQRAITALRAYKGTGLKRHHYSDFLEKCRFLKRNIKRILLHFSNKLKSNKKSALERWRAEITSLHSIFKRKMEKDDEKLKISLKQGPSAVKKRIDTKILMNHNYKEPSIFFETKS